MGDRSGIEWTDATWNPLVGCSKASAGCDNCYAIRVAHRGLAVQHRGLTVVPEGTTTPEWNGEVNLVPELLDQPLRWRRPRRIFVNSLSDLFHPEVPASYIAKVWAVMGLADRHVFQVLTKRPRRMELLLNDDEWPARVVEATEALVDTSKAARKALEASGLPLGVLPNVWLGVSVEDNRVAWRADHLRATPAAVRWISAEPMIGPLDELDLTGMDWIVAGGESGPNSRPLHPDWLRDLRARCLERRTWLCGHGARPHGYEPGEFCPPERVDAGWTGPAFHFKQWGDWMPYQQAVEALGHDEPVFARAQREVLRAGRYEVVTDADPARAMVRVGKGKAGRELDGRTWDEWPAGHESLVEWAPEVGTRTAEVAR